MKFDERALGQTELTSSSGEAWVSAKDGSLLQYSLTQEGGEAYFGEGIEGRLVWNYTLSDVNERLALELPGDCLPEEDLDLPLPAGAADVASSPGMVFFNTTVSPPEILDFYTQRLKADGWEISDDLASMDFGDLEALFEQYASEEEEDGEGAGFDEYDSFFEDSQPAEPMGENGGSVTFKRGDQRLTLLISRLEQGFSVLVTEQ